MASQVRGEFQAKEEKIQLKRQQYQQEMEVIAGETKKLTRISRELKLGMIR